MKQTKKLDVEQIELLVKKAKGGDTASFGMIFDHLYDEIFRYSILKVGNKEVAQDIASETFSRGWSYLSRYRSKNFRSYLYVIARNLCYDFNKNQVKTTELSTEFDLPDNSINIESSIIKNENLEYLVRAILELPERYKEIIILRYINGLSIKETAKAIGASGQAVRTAQHRAIKKLIGLLET